MLMDPYMPVMFISISSFDTEAVEQLCYVNNIDLNLQKIFKQSNARTQKRTNWLSD